MSFPVPRYMYSIGWYIRVKAEIGVIVPYGVGHFHNFIQPVAQQHLTAVQDRTIVSFTEDSSMYPTINPTDCTASSTFIGADIYLDRFWL